MKNNIKKFSLRTAMKNSLLGIICFFAYTFSLHAQSLYGVTYLGGTDGGGTINKFLPATNDLIAVKSFQTFASFPYSNFIQASNGKIYGMSHDGGSKGYGAIFLFDPISSTYTILKNFDNTNGANPYGNLVQANDGKLYGMTNAGGINSVGVIFSFDLSSSTYTKLMDFDHSSGASPEGSLIQASDGKLYGMTRAGGSSDRGVIFSFDLSSSTYTDLEDFVNTNGADPYGSFIQATDGNLYGMTYGGGINSVGVIFSFDLSSSSYTKLMDFDPSSGASPTGSLIQATDGTFYGMTSGGGTHGTGVIFSFDPSSSTYTDLMNFDNVDRFSKNTSGAGPSGNLVQASDGKFYGMTDGGGSNGVGVIFSFDPSSLTYLKLQDFNGTNGGGPYGSLLQASDGNLYGMTHDGGIGYGVIFSFDPLSSIYTEVADMASNTGGAQPIGALVPAADRKLYGMTREGGSKGYGVIFSFDPSAPGYTTLLDFDGTNGGTPLGSLIQANDGRLYGMTYTGGNNNLGVIFSFDPSSFAYTKLKDFDNTIGANPMGSLVQANDGKLYGVTRNGGSGGIGVIFLFDPLSSIYTKLWDFHNGPVNGGDPYGSLIQASDGKFYGMTNGGGSSQYGIIFSFDLSSSSFTKLKDFDGTDGAYPMGSLIEANDGKLYGMTNGGGNNLGGVIFSFDLVSSTYTKLKDFNPFDGSGNNPFGSLMQASDGKLYGSTFQGGASDSGVIFSFDPSTSAYTKLQDFDNTNGAGPYFGSALIEVTGTVPVTLISFTGKNNGNSNRLSWKVDNEQNLNYYELQRGPDGQNFKGISQIKAAGNNNYTYSDPITTAVSSIYYYRLKSVDKDGKFKYSLVIKIRTDHNGFAVVNPNPFKNKLVVTIESLIQDKALFIISDNSGRQLYKENKLLSAGTNVLDINEADRLSKGTYLLTIITSKQTQSIKVVKGN